MVRSDDRNRPGFAMHDDGVKPKRTSVSDWRRRISDNLAYGLLVYTALQIFVTMQQLKQISHSMLPYLALVVLVVGVIPGARALERHWDKMDDEAAHDPAEAPRFRRDQAIIWITVIGLPFLVAGLARAFHSLAG